MSAAISTNGNASNLCGPLQSATRGLSGTCDENLHIARLIEREIAALELKRDAATDSEERFLLKAEIRHLYALKTSLNRKFPKRRPPEAGIAVPVVPPKGPLPKQGGAAAPLDFDG